MSYFGTGTGRKLPTQQSPDNRYIRRRLFIMMIVRTLKPIRSIWVKIFKANKNLIYKFKRILYKKYNQLMKISIIIIVITILIIIAFIRYAIKIWNDT